MSEYGPKPEIRRSSVLSGEFGDLLDPQAYIEGAKRGMAALRELLLSVES